MCEEMMDHPQAASFDQTLQAHALGELTAQGVGALQVNLGKLCNQACRHCHVDAGPNRTEIMTRETVDQVLAAVRRYRIPTVDITGGAPELNPSFRHLIEESHATGSRVLVRHNLTGQFVPGHEDLPAFFRDNRVEVIASLPYYLAQQTDAQRGHGVFERSIEAMRRLNQEGFGQEDTELALDLVYNPVGAFLPPEQSAIERDFKRELKHRHGVVFNHLYTITNMPIRRFLDYLHKSANYERYMQKLVASFNPATVKGLMCRTMVSVGWDGRLYDCDFNQMLELPLTDGHPRTIDRLDLDRLATRRIATGVHCFGCTAGAGSSCGGAVAK
jgi:radical SAM/Cys-rich protein